MFQSLSLRPLIGFKRQLDRDRWSTVVIRNRKYLLPNDEVKILRTVPLVLVVYVSTLLGSGIDMIDIFRFRDCLFRKVKVGYLSIFSLICHSSRFFFFVNSLYASTVLFV